MASVPIFTMLVGIPGSGKTAEAEKIVRANGSVHLSSDAIRKELYGDASIQGDPSKVFSLMHKRTLEALDNGYNVVYDATNLSRKDRASILSKLSAGIKKECAIVWAPIEACIGRDNGRDRHVGKEVIDRMVKRFQAPWYDEGFDNIYVVRPEDFSYESACEYEKFILHMMKIPHDNPHHTYPIDAHCKLAGDWVALELDAILPVCRAAYLHDIGKIYTKSFKDAKGNDSDVAHYYGHQNVGAWMSYGFEGVNPYVAWLISNHMEPFFNSKYYKNLSTYLKADLDLLHEADLNAH